MHSIIANVTVLAVDDNTLQFVLVSSKKKKKKRQGTCWRSEETLLTSRPVCATIWAARNDGRPRKVITGFEPARRALRRRSCGLCTVLVIVEELGMVSGCKLDESSVIIVVHSPDVRIREADATRAYDNCTVP